MKKSAPSTQKKLTIKKIVVKDLHVKTEIRTGGQTGKCTIIGPGCNNTR